MSDQVVKLIVGAALLLHGLGHGGALGALIWIDRRPGTDTGGWQAARSWAFPALASTTATTVASVFWVLAMIGFVAAAMALWGFLLPADVWRPVAVVSAIVSLLGIALFIGTWPPFNTVAALGMNVAVLVALLWLHWPSQAMLGR
jgi:hypothetical protein